MDTIKGFKTEYEIVNRYFGFILPALFVLAYIVYLFRFGSQTENVLPHFLMFGIVIATLYLGNASEVIRGKEQIVNASRKEFIDNLLKGVDYEVATDTIGIYPDIVNFTKTKFRFLPKYPELVDIFQEIKFASTFDKPAYLNAVCLTEEFLKLYFQIIMHDDLDYCKMQFQRLKDIRTELLNVMHTLAIGVPSHVKRPILKRKQPLDNFIVKKIRSVQAITYKHMKIVSTKCNTRNEIDLRGKPPLARNHYKDNRFYVY
jgi:hypothetical protein